MRRPSTKSFIRRPAALHLSVAITAWLVNRASRRVRSKNGANPFLGLAALLCHQICLSRPRDVCLAKSEVAWHAHLAWTRRSLCLYARPAVAQSRFRTDRARGAAAFCENPWQRRNSIGIEAAAHWQPRSLPSLRRSCGSDRLPAGLRRTVRSPWQSRSRSEPSPWRRSGRDPRRSRVL